MVDRSSAAWRRRGKRQRPVRPRPMPGKNLSSAQSKAFRRPRPKRRGNSTRPAGLDRSRRTTGDLTHAHFQHRHCPVRHNRTRPFNAASGFGFVKRLTIIVIVKFAIHETAATINAWPIPLLISKTGAIHPPLPSAIVNPCVNAAAAVPESNPQKTV